MNEDVRGFLPMDHTNIGCAFCHLPADESERGPLMYTLPPMDYPGMMDARVNMRLHAWCYKRLINIIGSALGIEEVMARQEHGTRT